MSKELPRCSFCGKSRDVVRRLIAGPGVYICDGCVDLCVEVLDAGGGAPGGSLTRVPPAALRASGSRSGSGSGSGRWRTTASPGPSPLRRLRRSLRDLLRRVADRASGGGAPASS